MLPTRIHALKSVLQDEPSPATSTRQHGDLFAMLQTLDNEEENHGGGDMVMLPNGTVLPRRAHTPHTWSHTHAAQRHGAPQVPPQQCHGMYTRDG